MSTLFSYFLSYECTEYCYKVSCWRIWITGPYQPDFVRASHCFADHTLALQIHAAFSPHLVAHSHYVFLHFTWNSGAIICHEPKTTSEALSCSKNGQGETSEDLFLLTRNLYNTGVFSCGTCGGSKTSISTPSQPESYADSGRRVRPGPHGSAGNCANTPDSESVDHFQVQSSRQ